MKYLTVFYRKRTGEIVKAIPNTYVRSRKQIPRLINEYDISDIGHIYVEGIDYIDISKYRVEIPSRIAPPRLVSNDGQIFTDQIIIDQAISVIQRNDPIDVVFEGGMGDYLLQMDAIGDFAKRVEPKKVIVHALPDRIGLLELIQRPKNVTFASTSPTARKGKEVLDMSKITTLDYYRPPFGKAYTYGLLLGYPGLFPLCRIKIPKHLKDWAKKEKKEHLGRKKRPLVGLHWRSGEPNAKSWFYDHALEFAKLLHEKVNGITLFFGGFGEERPTEKYTWEFVGRGTWEQSAALVDVCDILVAIDSAFMHIGLRLRKKVVSLWGPTSKEQILSKYAEHISIEGKCPQRPCTSYQCSTRACMRGIEPQHVVDIVLGEIAKK